MKRRILIAEDYDDTRNMMKLFLESFGYEVTEAADGSEAVEKVKTDLPDLILMDIAMPVMNGIEATRTIRTFAHSSKIPIICVTAHGKQFHDEAIQAGCNDLIGKPLDFDRFLSTIRQHIH